MTILLGHDESVAAWVASQVGKEFHTPYTAIGVLNGTGALKGGFVFTNYNGSSIELSLAGAGVALWRIGPAILEYVFGQLKCSRLEVHTAAENKAVRKLAPKLGFTFEGKSRNFYGRGKDALLYSLTSDDLPSFRRRWRL